MAAEASERTENLCKMAKPRNYGLINTNENSCRECTVLLLAKRILYLFEWHFIFPTYIIFL